MKKFLIIAAFAVTLAGCTENVYSTTFVEPLPVYRPAYTRPLREPFVEYRSPVPLYRSTGPTVLFAPPYVGGSIYPAPRTYVPRSNVYRHAPAGDYTQPHIRPAYPYRYDPRSYYYR